MHTSNHDAVFTCRAVAWQAPADATTRRTPPYLSAARAAVVGLLRDWRKQQRLRRELSLMSPRDFGDLAVPPSLVRDELRRWPWQRQSVEWGELAPRRQRSK
jgi:uncharacterized protein YjiS (DUF1127 family)